MKRLKGASADKPLAFLTDLYADLRERRLLPLVALLVVGIIAAPILLKNKGEAEPAPVPTPSPAAASASSFDVVPASQELQAYRKRLGDRKPKDPFQPAGTGGQAPSGGGEGGAGSAPGAAAAPVAETSAPPAVTQEESVTTTESTVQTRIEPVDVTFGINARLGVPKHIKERRGIKPQAKLPSGKNPVLVYLGPANDGKHALILLSSQVLSYSGPAHCAVDKSNCQLLEVAPGTTVGFVYGARETHLYLTVEKFVTVAHLPGGKERILHDK